MKFLIKFFASFALLFFMAGIALTIVGLALGGDFRQALRYTSVNDHSVSGMGLFDHWGFFWDDNGNDWDDNYEVAAVAPPEAPSAVSAPARPGTVKTLGSYKGMDNLVPAGVSSTTQLDFDLGGVKKVEILAGEGFGLYREGDVGRLTSVMEDGTTWEIKSKNRNKVSGTLTIILPEGMLFDEIDLLLGAGALTGSGLQALDLDLEVGAGSITVTDLWAETAEFTAQAGNLEVTGVVTQKAELVAQAGAVKLTTPEPDYYGYKIECNVGTVAVGDESFSALSATQRQNTDAPMLYKINCNAGSAQVVFKN